MNRSVSLAAMVVVALMASVWPGPRGAGAAAGPIRVLYAGSLVNVFERDLGPAFTRASGIPVLGRAGGSTALAHMIRDGLVPADVFVSAEPGVNGILAPQAGAPSVSWYLTFGTTSMVIAYAPGSRFAPTLRIGPWFHVLASPGLRLGRTDPALDPKGFRTILVAQLAEAYYHERGLAQRLLGPDENPSQIFPEEALVGRLTSGQLDVGFFYLVEAVAEHLPYVTLPPAVNLSDPEFAATYGAVSWVDSSGAKHTGAPIVYTVTIPSSARNPDGAARFVAFLLGREARALLTSRGILAVPVRAGGRTSEVPPSLRPFVTGPFQP